VAIQDLQATSPKVTLLDCTLRDGGYYNDWDYTPTLVNRYLQAMGAARIPIVEIGFRTTETGRYMGPTAYSTDRYLESLDLPSNVAFGVMVNAKELVAGGRSDKVVDQLFRASDRSPVRMVRIAANFSEVEALTPGVARLHDLGYRVGVNLMQIASRTEDEIRRFAELARSWKIEVTYFADSFGGMHPPQIAQIVQTLSDGFGGPIGCHTHDNMSMALANTLAAIEAGATYVDATVLGMGRGPGNARTEYVAYELNRRGLAELDAVKLLPLVTGDFADLQREYGWGSNIYYFLSAANNIHPTYIQEMTKDGRYAVQEIVGALDELSTKGGASFSKERLESASAAIGLDEPSGTYDASGWCDGRDVMIVGPGPIGRLRRPDIESYIRSHRPIVIALNPVPPVDPTLVDAYALAHPVRAVIDADEIAALDRPIFMPASVQSKLDPPPPAEHTRDYGLAVAPSTLQVEPTACVIPRIASFPYALAIAVAGGAHRVLLTGFDGFDHGDPRQTEMEEVFRLVSTVADAPPVIALTKSTYSVQQSSIYAV